MSLCEVSIYETPDLSLSVTLFSLVRHLGGVPVCGWWGTGGLSCVYSSRTSLGSVYPIRHTASRKVKGPSLLQLAPLVSRTPSSPQEGTAWAAK